MCFVFGTLNLLIRYGAAKIVWLSGEYGGVEESCTVNIVIRVAQERPCKRFFDFRKL